MDSNNGKPSSGRFRGARSRESAEAQVQSKIALRLHRLWVRLLWIGGARRLAENPDVSVLLLEAGGSDDVQA